MPRNPVAGVVSGVFGLAWAALGLVLAAWAAATKLEVARGFDLALWALQRSPVDLPWDPVDAANYAINHVVPAVIVAAIALVLAWTNLRTARIALRAQNESHDGRGELQPMTQEPRVGRPFEGVIRLREATPGDEYDVSLVAASSGNKPAYRSEQKARARHGAQGVNLPFRFEVPATAPASGVATRWHLEFAPTGRRTFGRSRLDVKLAPAPEGEARAAAHGIAPAASMPGAASPQAQGYVEHIERLYGALGGKLSEQQRQHIRAKLSGPQAQTMQGQLEAFRKLTPQHVKLLKYAVVGFVLLFFVLPFVLSVLGMVLAAIFSA